ncbi:23S rRNA m(5)U-1939 methyltransferase [Rhodovulum sp. ES.010]|uniref:class I SAM-dependent RNA methyltransferase n=1 Tax=Rhodovulum sp. ES.010 TaxID=1882821 RepID=UPI000929CE68|nr:class I SAM-dependent RNA methyltransferase [Rhodovulum sp. ES.010]SIO49234.1 23S rRNA m(5)U-1939 methyltransferase [Rhodovulum sp. ES.010]
MVVRLNLRGEGVTAEGVTVPCALPGEEVAGEAEEGRIAAPRILAPVPDRVRAPCPHFARCGGCTLQHARDGFVASWKTDVVRAALAAHGLEAPVQPILTSPPASRRRAVLSGRRTKSGALVGFHARASDQVVAIPDCRLLHPDLMAALPACADLTALGASRKGELALSLTRSEDGVDLAVAEAKTLDDALRVALADLARRHDLARLAWNGEIVLTRRPPRQAFGRAHVVTPPGAFLQATEDGQAALTAAALEVVADGRRIIDLFAGCGTFTLPLAEAAEVHAAESDAAMLAALDSGWRGATGLKRVTHEVRDLFRNPVRPEELGRFDAAVLDPPRAGAAAQVAQIAASGLSRLAYVSCNPVTFARDAKRLCSAGFRLEWVQVVDQFRWSGHVELAAALRRDHMA